MNEFFTIYLHYLDELWLSLLIGFVLSGVFFVYIPLSVVEKYLGRKNLSSMLIASVIGVVLPICCIGSLPVAMTLRRKGASLGAVLSFLVATPATSIPALIICWKLLGVTFTVAIFIVIVCIALIMGIVGNRLKGVPLAPEEKHDCCHEKKEAPQGSKLKRALTYSFITLPKQIGKEIIIGIAVAAFITTYEPLQQFIHQYLTGAVGYVFVLLFGLVTYVCSTASVPMADAFIQSGLTQGQALCYLLVGPITSYATLLVIRKDFGNHVLVAYLTVLTVFSVAFGIAADLFLF